MGGGWLQGPLLREVLITAAVVAMAASAASLLRRGALRQRVSDGVQQFGGGMYGLAAFGTWLYLEGLSLARELFASEGMAGFLEGRAWELVIGFSADLLRNLLQAAFWPMYWLREGGFLAAVLVGGAAWAVMRLVGSTSPVD